MVDWWMEDPYYTLGPCDDNDDDESWLVVDGLGGGSDRSVGVTWLTG